MEGDCEQVLPAGLLTLGDDVPWRVYRLQVSVNIRNGVEDRLFPAHSSDHDADRTHPAHRHHDPIQDGF